MVDFNISWHETPEKTIRSHIPNGPKLLTKPGMNNFSGDHMSSYQKMLEDIEL